MRPEEKAQIPAKHALLVNKKLYCMNKKTYTVQIPSPSLKMSSLFEYLCQAGSRIHQDRKSAVLVLLGSTASPRVPWAPPGGAPLESPVLCPAPLATSVPGRVQTVSLFPAPKAPTAPTTVSPQLVKTQKLNYLSIVWLLGLILIVNDLLRQVFGGVTLQGFNQIWFSHSGEVIWPVYNKIKLFHDSQNFLEMILLDLVDFNTLTPLAVCSHLRDMVIDPTWQVACFAIWTEVKAVNLCWQVSA